MNKTKITMMVVCFISHVYVLNLHVANPVQSAENNFTKLCFLRFLFTEKTSADPNLQRYINTV